MACVRRMKRELRRWEMDLGILFILILDGTLRYFELFINQYEYRAMLLMLISDLIALQWVLFFAILHYKRALKYAIIYCTYVMQVLYYP